MNMVLIYPQGHFLVQKLIFCTSNSKEEVILGPKILENEYVKTCFTLLIQNSNKYLIKTRIRYKTSSVLAKFTWQCIFLLCWFILIDWAAQVNCSSRDKCDFLILKRFSILYNWCNGNINFNSIFIISR